MAMTSRPAVPRIVGREPELQAIEPFLAAAARGHAALVFEGDPGIGKTSLWHATTALAETRGFRVLAVRATEPEAKLGLAAIGDLAAALAADDARLPDAQRRALGVALHGMSPGAEPLDPRALGLALVGLLQAAAARTPILLAVDDAQWVDESSAAVLHFALRRVAPGPIGLVVSRRRPGGPPELDLASDLAGSGGGHLDRVEVGPLDRDAIARLVSERERRALPPPEAAQLHRVSGGNPFLALELAQALTRHAVTSQAFGAFPVPRDLRALVRDRLAGLSPRGRNAALLVASMSAPTLERVEALEPAADAGDDGLTEAIELGILELDGDRLRFSHPLISSILYSEASPARRREIHARLATVGGSEERAGHLALATVEPDATVAAELEAAARQALARGAPQASAELFDHAARLTPELDREAGWRRALEAGNSLLVAGASARARDAFTSLLAAAPTGPWRARALSRLAAVMIFEEDWRSAAPLWWEALEEAPDQRVRARCLQGLGWAAWFEGDLASATARFAQASVAAEAAEAPAILATILAEGAYFAGLSGEPHAAELSRRAIEAAQDAGTSARIDALRWSFPLLMWSDDFESARERGRQVMRDVLEIGVEDVAAELHDGLGDIARDTGAPISAIAEYTAGLRAAEQTGQAWMTSLETAKLAIAEVMAGRLEDGMAHAREARLLAKRVGVRQPEGFHALGLAALSSGDAEEAAEHLLAAIEISNAVGVREPGHLAFVPDAVEALVELGRLDEARAVLEPFESRAVALDRTWALGAVARCRALLDETSHPEVAWAAATEATRIHSAGPRPFELGRSLLVRGRIERHLKQRGAARQTLEESRATFEGMGATVWAERAAAELARIGGRARGPSGLTPTEREVARLAADGRTNREIAAALFLSVNTVQTYLKHVFAELGVRSRTELARRSLDGASPPAPPNSPDSGGSAPTRQT